MNLSSVTGAGATSEENGTMKQHSAGTVDESEAGKTNNDHGQEQSPTPASFFWWLLSLRADLLSGNVERWPEMLDALSQKHDAVLLTSDQALLRGALALHTLMPSRSDQSTIAPLTDANALADVIAIHRAHMSDSASSALNARVCAAYASLVAHLHYAYMDLKPIEVEDLSNQTSKNDAQQHIDLVQSWTGLKEAPTFHADGSYATTGLVRAPKRKQAIAVGQEAQWDALLSVESVREALRDANSRVAGDPSQSQWVWSLYCCFEMTHFPARPTAQDVEQIKALFLARLVTPHTQIDLTAQAFSTFVTNALPSSEYEDVMTNAYKLVGRAKATLAACEPYESVIQSTLSAGATNTAARWTAWKPFTAWASSNAVGAPGIRRQTTAALDVDTICAQFERALLDCGLPPSCAEESLSHGGPPLTKEELAILRGKESREQRKYRMERETEAIRRDQEASADLWTSYLHFLGSVKASATIVLDVCARAGKALPSNGPLLATILRTFGRVRRSQDQIDQYFSSALRSPGVQTDGAAMAELFLARIDVERDQISHRLVLQGQSSSMQQALSSLAKQPDTFMNMFGIMSFGLDTMAGLGLQDESLRLERTVTDWCLQGGTETAALADDCWQAAIKLQPHNGDVWLRASQFAVTRSLFDQAKHFLKQGLSRRDVQSSKKLVLAEELLHLAHVAGTIQDVDWALARITTERERSWSEYYATYEVQPQSSESVVTGVHGAADVEMTDSTSLDKNGAKRKADGADAAAITLTNAITESPQREKKGKQGDVKVQRDRENSSVMVDNLPPDAVEEDVLTLFKGCGDILIITGPRLVIEATKSDSTSEGRGEGRGATALVEFTAREAIPAVLSRHLKPVRSFQVEIRLGYECTLYVTNFPPSFDTDTAIRGVFEQYGRIFDVRWPSKKFAAQRRFCYVVFCSAAEAHAAQRRLHNIQLDSAEPNIRMQVLLSDPNRKKVRSDAFSDERELFVNGLPRGANEEELAALFGPDVDQVRIPKHPDGRNRGIAYVDMHTALDAQRVLGKVFEIDGGGYRIKGKLLTVSLVDRMKKTGQNGSGSGGTAFKPNASLDGHLDVDRRNRCLRVHGLPSDAQEAIIQQVVEHSSGRGSVKRVEWTPGEASHGQAIVEFCDSIVAGRVALEAATSLSYDEQHPLQLLSLESRGAAARMRASGPSTSDEGNERKAGATHNTTDTLPPPPPPSSSSQDTNRLVPRQAIISRRGGRRGGLGGHVTRHARMDVDDEHSDGNGVSAKAKGQDAFRQMLQQGKTP